MRTLLFMICAAGLAPANEHHRPHSRMLFDFEKASDIEDWSPTDNPEMKEMGLKPKVEGSTQNATSGKHSLKISYDGMGEWPTVAVRKFPVPGAWPEFKALTADVTVSRGATVVLRLYGEKSGRNPEAHHRSRWNRVLMLLPGTNRIQVNIVDVDRQAYGPVAELDLMMYRPQKGESLYFDNVRLQTEQFVDPPEPEEPPTGPYDQLGQRVNYMIYWPSVGGEAPSPAYSEATRLAYDRMKARWRFTVTGAKRVVGGPFILGRTVNPTPSVADFKPPPQTTVAGVEGDFRKLHADLKKKHPKAVLAVFRDGEPVFGDGPKYSGWRDASLGIPGAEGPERTATTGGSTQVTLWMRGASMLMKADLSAIPKRATILAARLVLSGLTQPTGTCVFISEPCNRPWEEAEVNTYEYARNKAWKQVGGIYYGPDPDFHPAYLAHGPMTGWPVSAWDFTEAVKFWTDGTHENHGFAFFDSGGKEPLGSTGYYQACFSIPTRENPDVKSRPALLVIYTE